MEMEMESEDMEMEQGGILRDEAVALLNTYKYNVEVASKMEPLRKLKEVLIHRDPRLLPEFVPYLMELQSERFSPIRKFLVEMIEEIGLKYLEHLPAMVPVLIAFLKDDTPAVARQAVTTGTNLFRNTLEQVTLQGIYSGQVHKWLEDTWACMVKFKDAVYPIAFQPGTDGAKLVAVKFVETTILLFTSDPNVSLQVPPPQQSSDGKSKGFNISWILGGHPVLDAGLLGQEASKNLGFLLDQLRLPDVRVLQSSVAIVLINSLSSIAKKRPGLYGRVLPALLGLVSSFEGVKGPQFASVQNTLKNAFVGFLKCTHPGALPWRDRLVGALRAMNAADLAEQVLRQVDKMLKNAEHSSEASSEQKPPNQHYNMLAGEAGQKRALVQDNGNQTTMDDKQVKRIRHSSPVLQQFQFSCHLKNESATSNGNCPGVVKIDPEMSPVQQLVAMFGAIVAQGDRAVESLEILISKIPTDLLAEVVIANMHNLPSTPPQSDSDEHELPGGISQSSIIGTMSQLMPSLNIISQVMQMSTSIPPTSMPLMTISQVPSAKNITSSEVKVAVSQQLTSDTSHNNLRDPGWLDTQHMPAPVGVSLAAASIDDTTAAPFVSGGGVNSSMTTQPLIESQSLTTISNKDQKEGPENIIPGIGGPLSVDIKMETVEKSVDSYSVPVIATPNTLNTGSESNEMQEPLLSGPPGTDKFGPAISRVPALEPIRSSSLVPITTMPVAPASGFAAVPPIITLTVEQQASLSRSAFARIIEAYRQVSLAGGCELRVSLLTRLADQCDADYDAREILQKHILSDYQNFKGHEMTLHVLYRLFGDIVSKEKDTGLPSEVDLIYESFLLIVAQTLRDSLPSSDKSLSKLLGEVPLLPDAAFKILEDLCCVGRFDKDGKEMQSGERVVQGLSAVWSLILLRPPARDICLDIALKTAVHRIEEVRTRAIRLVANKLYPLSYISQNIEEFATKMMLSVAHAPQNGDSMDLGASRIVGKETDNDLPNGRPKVTEGGGITGENTNGNDQPTSAHSVSNLSVTEALRCMSLYFALCTKKPTLLQQVFSIYKTVPKAAKQAVQRQMGPLIHTISLTGVPSDLLRIISNPSAGSESLLMQVLHLLTDRVTPPPELIATVKKLYETKLKDAGVLIPILSSLTKDEVLPIFPQLVNLPLEKFQDALARILQGSAHTGPALTPAEVLIAIHGIDPEREGIPLKKVTDACSACFEQRKVFTQQVLAKVLNQLVEQTPLPLLFMRTVIQAVGAFPSLMDFIMEILSRLVNKQIWKFPKLWVGFLKCAYQTKPHSFHVLLQLPATQLENALNKNPTLKTLLVGHANQPSIRSTLPRSTLVVLGLVQDNQSANTASQTPQPMDATPAGQTGNETQASESAAAS